MHKSYVITLILDGMQELCYDLKISCKYFCLYEICVSTFTGHWTVAKSKKYSNITNNSSCKSNSVASVFEQNSACCALLQDVCLFSIT
jgi:hypothetical protein